MRDTVMDKTVTDMAVGMSKTGSATTPTPTAGAALGWPVERERRRPGRAASVSPELIALMREPASHAARLRVALYDAPGFVLPTHDTLRPPRATGFPLRVAVAVVGAGAGWAAVFQAMCWAWG